MFPVKRIVRTKVNSAEPFLIEWDTAEPCENSWVPWKNLGDEYKKKYCKNGEVRQKWKTKRRREIAALNKSKRRKKKTVERAQENEAIIPARRTPGTVEYSEYEQTTEGGLCHNILVIKTYHNDKVHYQHFRRISRSVHTINNDQQMSLLHGLESCL